MRAEDKKIDPLPDSFKSEEAAGEFRDTHSPMDYQQYLQPTEDKIEISERIFDELHRR
jgi:hypothetical protein